MPIVVDTITGRLGKYNITIYERDSNQNRAIDVELESDVVIEYGELDRSPARQVLKSYVNLSFVDEGLDLHNFFRGGFSTDQYILEITGPNLNWKGILKEEARTVPLTQRVQKERTVLRFYGGIVKERIKVRDTTRARSVTEVATVHNITSSLIIDSGLNTAAEIREGERIRSNLEIKTEDNNWLSIEKPDSNSNNEVAKVLDIFINNNYYEAIKSFLKLSGGVLYRSLSTGNVVLDQSYLNGSSGSFKKKDPSDSSYSDTTRSSFVNEVDIENIIIGDSESGLRDLKKVGDILISFDKGDNIGGMGAVEDGSSSFTAFEITSISGGRRFQDYVGRDSDTLLETQFRDTSVSTLNIGKIDPTVEIGIVVKVEEIDTNGSKSDLTITVEYNNSSGDSTSVTGPSNGEVIKGPTTIEEFEPDIKFDYSGSDNLIVKYRVAYLSNEGKEIESLIASSQQSGVESIEVGEEISMPTYKIGTFNIRQSRKIRDSTLGISNNSYFLFRAALERKYRPFDTQTLKGKLLGIFGPEYVHRITEDSKISYWIPTGIKCNITKGTTDIAAVEMPKHILK